MLKLANQTFPPVPLIVFTFDRSLLDINCRLCFKCCFAFPIASSLSSVYPCGLSSPPPPFFAFLNFILLFSSVFGATSFIFSHTHILARRLFDYMTVSVTTSELIPGEICQDVNTSQHAGYSWVVKVCGFYLKSVNCCAAF